MPRSAHIDSHPQREAIIKAMIARRQPLSAIDRKYGLTRGSCSYYLHAHLMPRAAKTLAMRDVTDAATVIEKTQEIGETLQRMYDACDKWLRDPDSPDEYYLGPRDNEVDVVYEEDTGEVTKDGRPIMRRRKDRLSKLLHEVDHYISSEYRHADPRRLVLQTSETLGRHLDRIAEIMGLVPKAQVNITLQSTWVVVKAIIDRGTAKFPEARAAIAQELALELAKQDDEP